MDIEWRESTSNHWVADLGHGLTIEIERPRKLKYRHLGWKIILFGNPHCMSERFEDREDAMEAASKEAACRITAVAKMIKVK